MTITVYIQGWKTNSRCTGKGAVTSFFFFKADICTLIVLKNEKNKRKKNQNKQKQKQNEVVSCLPLFVKLYSKLYKFHFDQTVCV